MSHAEIHPSSSFEPVRMTWYGTVLEQEPDMPPDTVGVLAVYRAPLWVPSATPILISATSQRGPSSGQLADLQAGDIVRLEGVGHLIDPGRGSDLIFTMVDPAVELVERQLPF